MIANTINDDKTIAGGGEGAVLARWYRQMVSHHPPQLGEGGIGAVLV